MPGGYINNSHKHGKTSNHPPGMNVIPRVEKHVRYIPQQLKWIRDHIPANTQFILYPDRSFSPEVPRGIFTMV